MFLHAESIFNFQKFKASFIGFSSNCIDLCLCDFHMTLTKTLTPPKKITLKLCSDQ